MNRSVFAPALTFVLGVTFSSSVFAQAQPAAPTTPAPAAKAKFVTPLKGLATVEVIQERSKFVGKEIVTVFKIKNTSKAPIALLKIDEYWYDNAGKLVSSDTQRHRQPLAPGEIVEMTTRSPAVTGAARSRAQFAHANGEVKPTAVKQFK
jgi:hypothetical protein